MIWKCSQYSFDAKMPIIMGILNLTPDSFSDGGSYPTPEDAIARGLQMVEEGALIIDVGGESTRPGATPVTEEEECARVLDVVKALASKGICVSIDTRHAPVARAALEAGASIINDVRRDAHQSLIATRMTTEQMLPIIDKMDKVGYHSVECWGGATFDASLRFLKEDPWERLRKLRDGFKNTKLQMLFRGQNILGYRH